jgi:hypothetical protein
VEVRAVRDSGLEARDSKDRDSGFEVRDSGFGIRDPKAVTRDSNVIEFNKRPVWRRPSILLPWAAAASIALVAGYQSLVVVPGLRQAISPQSLSPVMLREADARISAGRDRATGTAFHRPRCRRDDAIGAERQI